MIRTLLLHAALDGELDAAGMMEIEARLAADTALAAEYAGCGRLRAAIRARIPRDAAPDALARPRHGRMALGPRPLAADPVRTLVRRVILSLAQSAPRDAGGRVFALRLLEFALSFARRLADAWRHAWRSERPGCFGASPPATISSGRSSPAMSGGVFRASPSMSATSDRHTVKPWLAGKIATPTTVVDLAKDGFPLVGGRIDVIGMTPVATLIYQRREHQIALTEMRASGDAQRRRAAKRAKAILC